MAGFNIHLFGNLRIQRHGHEFIEINGGKLQELFGYLMLHRSIPHTRESLGVLLWEDCADSQSRKCLRQTLWQLQNQLNPISEQEQILLTKNGTIRVNPNLDLRIDTELFEDTFEWAKNIDGAQLTYKQAELMHTTVEFYKGNLLEGCYKDWCICERERLQDMHLAILDKLIRYCESHKNYAQALSYGERILRFDSAHERTHRAMMRIKYLSNDRTGALHQYERCVASLLKELDVGPSPRTTTLYNQIKDDSAGGFTPLVLQSLTNLEHTTSCMPEILEQFKALLSALPDIEERLRADIQAIEKNLVAKNNQIAPFNTPTYEKIDDRHQNRRQYRRSKDGH